MAPWLFAAAYMAFDRLQHIWADMAYRGNMKKRLQRANASGARFAVILGDDEVASGTAQLKDLESGEQRAVAFDSVAEALRP